MGKCFTSPLPSPLRGEGETRRLKRMGGFAKGMATDVQFFFFAKICTAIKLLGHKRKDLLF